MVLGVDLPKGGRGHPGKGREEPGGAQGAQGLVEGWCRGLTEDSGGDMVDPSRKCQEAAFSCSWRKCVIKVPFNLGR